MNPVVLGTASLSFAVMSASWAKIALDGFKEKDQAKTVTHVALAALALGATALCAYCLAVDS